MELAVILLQQVVIMLLYLCIGIMCHKTGLITDTSNKGISNLVLYVINPVLIFVSYQQEFSMKLLSGLGTTFALSTIGYVLFIIGAMLLVRGGDNASRATEIFSVIYSNCGFMGIPIAKVLFGNEGVFYITAFNTVFNILVWTHGVTLISGDKSQMNLKKIVTNPTIIATFIGFLFFVLKIQLPEMIYSACSTLSSSVAPLAMIVAGVIIAQTSILKAISKPRIYFVCLLKLLVFPVLCLWLFTLIPFEISEMAELATVLAFCCPTATMGTMFAVRYDKNAVYAAEIFAVTTILSVLTMPAVIFIQQAIF